MYAERYSAIGGVFYAVVPSPYSVRVVRDAKPVTSNIVCLPEYGGQRRRRLYLYIIHRVQKTRFHSAFFRFVAGNFSRPTRFPDTTGEERERSEYYSSREISRVPLLTETVGDDGSKIGRRRDATR